MLLGLMLIGPKMLEGNRMRFRLGAGEALVYCHMHALYPPPIRPMRFRLGAGEALTLTLTLIGSGEALGQEKGAGLLV